MTTLYTIGSDPDAPAPKTQRKTRSFSAHLLACIKADALWSGGQADTQAQRPVAAWFAGSDDALRPFVANLREGRKAMAGHKARSSDALEFLRSAGYHVAWQRYPEGSVARLWLPDLFAFDPGPSEEGAPVAFVTSPSVAWAQGLGLTPEHEARVWAHLRLTGLPKDHELPAHAPWLALAWAAQLDRRVRWPLVNDARFAAQLLVAFLDAQRAWRPSYGGSFGEDNVGTVGLLSGVATQASQDDVATLVARETERYFAVVDEPRATRASAVSKPAPATQMGLAF